MTSTPIRPWGPMARLLYLAVGVWMIVEAGYWSLSLAVPLLLCFLPALLHSALSLPRWRPVIGQRRYLVRWIYGLPILALLAWVSAWTILPVMDSHKGNNMRFFLARLYRQLPAERQDIIALMGRGIAALLLAWCWSHAKVVGWRRAASTHPSWTMLTLLCVPLCGAVAIAQSFTTLGLPDEALASAATTLHTFPYSQFVIARLTVLVEFPVAITAPFLGTECLPSWLRTQAEA